MPKPMINTDKMKGDKLDFAAGGSKRGVMSPTPGFHHGRPIKIKK